MSGVKKKRQIINYLFFNDLRRYWIISILLLVQQFIFIPFRIVLYSTGDFSHQAINWGYFLNFKALESLNAISLALISILIATSIFSEIQKVNDNIHLHSLPFNKKNIFINKVLVGMLLIFISVFINFAITYILALRFNKLDITINYVIKYFLVAFSASMVFYMQGVFFSIVTSSIPLQVFVSFSINLLPAFIDAFGNRLLNNLLVGRINEPPIIRYKHLLPLENIMVEEIINIGFFDIVLYLLSILCIFSISYFLYIKRKNENSNQTIVFEFLNPVFKYITTFLSMLFFTSFILDGYSNNLYKIIVYAFIGSFIGYYVAQMIILKEINVLRYLKGFYIYTTLMAIFCILLLNTNIFYFNTPPKPEDVKRAYVTANDAKSYKLSKNKLELPIKNEDTIKKVISLHQYMIEQSKENQFGPPLTIAYELNNGKKIKRRYKRIAIKNEVDKYLNEISKDEDYKKEEFDILNINHNHIVFIEIIQGDKFVEVKDKEKIKYIIDKIKNNINDIEFDYEREITLRVVINDNYSAENYNRWLIYGLSKNNKWIYEFLK